MVFASAGMRKVDINQLVYRRATDHCDQGGRPTGRMDTAQQLHEFDCAAADPGGQGRIGNLGGGTDPDRRGETTWPPNTGQSWTRAP